MSRLRRCCVRKAPLSVGEQAEYNVQVEGVFKTNGACRLRLLPDGRIVSGKIIDPVLSVPGNVYTAALNENRPLHVVAKPTLKDGSIRTLFVSHAELAGPNVGGEESVSPSA